MLIVDTSCTLENPYIHISGNIDNENIGCKQLIYLGSKSNCHYQSLLEKEDNIILQIDNNEVHEKVAEDPPQSMSQNKGKSIEVVSKEKPLKEVKLDATMNIGCSYVKEKCSKMKESTRVSFMYESNGALIEFKCMSDNYIMKCPACNLETRYIIQHIMKGKCQIIINIDAFKLQFQKYKDKDKDKKTKELSEKKQMRRQILREQNEEKLKNKEGLRKLEEDRNSEQ